MRQFTNTKIYFHLAPDGPPTPFEFTPQRPGVNVEFFWSPPDLLRRNGDITNYTLTCTPVGVTGVSPVTMTYPEAGTYTLGGFKPVTTYNCVLTARNSAGVGPPATTTEATLEDGRILKLVYIVL